MTQETTVADVKVEHPLVRIEKREGHDDVVIAEVAGVGAYAWTNKDTGGIAYAVMHAVASRLSTLRPETTASDDVVEAAPWRDYMTGSALSFEPGCLNIKRDGSGSFAFRDSVIDYEHDDETGADIVVASFPAGEAQAIRDYLNTWFPTANLPKPTEKDELVEARELLRQAFNALACADKNDPLESIADNGMTVWDGMRNEAERLKPLVLAALKDVRP